MLNMLGGLRPSCLRGFLGGQPLHRPWAASRLLDTRDSKVERKRTTKRMSKRDFSRCACCSCQIEDSTHSCRQLEGGYIPSALNNSGLAPIFSLSHVQFTLPAPLITLVASSNALFMALYPLSLIIIDLSRPEELINLELPKPAASGAGASAGASVVISKLFADPAGRHLLVTTSTADTFYLPIGGGVAGQVKKFRPLRLKQAVTAVAWSPSSSGSSTHTPNSQNPQPTVDILIGSSTGQISTLTLPPAEDMLLFKTVGIANKPLERDLHQVYALSEQAEITGLGCGFWGKGSSKKAWVLATTHSRIYEVQASVTTRSVAGKGGWAEEVFKPVRDGAPSGFSDYCPSKTDKASQSFRNFPGPHRSLNCAFTTPMVMARQPTRCCHRQLLPGSQVRQARRPLLTRLSARPLSFSYPNINLS